MAKAKKIENINKYFEWYANWMNFNDSTVESILEGKYGNPFLLLSEWLEHIALSGDEAVGKTVYYPVEQHNNMELSFDCWLDGVKIKKGVIDSYNDGVVIINNCSYYVGNERMFFEDEGCCIASITYDGADFLDFEIDGTIIIPLGYSKDLIIIDN